MTTAPEQTTTPDAAAAQDAPLDIEAMMRASIMGDDAPDSAPAPDKTIDDAGTADPEEEKGGEETEESGKDDDSADDTDDDANAQDLIKNPEALLKAHNEIKAKAAERLKRIEELEAKLAGPPEATGITVEPTKDAPLANVDTFADLEKARDYFTEQLEWCAENRDGGEHNGQERSAEWVASHKDFVKRVLKEGIAERRAFIEKRSQALQAGETVFDKLRTEHPDLWKQFSEKLGEEVKDQRKANHHRDPEWIVDRLRLYAWKLVESGTHGVSVKDGKVSLVKLGSGKAAPVVLKKPPTAPRATAPAGRKANTEDEMSAAIAAGDLTGALKAHLSQLQPAA